VQKKKSRGGGRRGGGLGGAPPPPPPQAVNPAKQDSFLSDNQHTSKHLEHMLKMCNFLTTYQLKVV